MARICFRGGIRGLACDWLAPRLKTNKEKKTETPLPLCSREPHLSFPISLSLSQIQIEAAAPSLSLSQIQIEAAAPSSPRPSSLSLPQQIVRLHSTSIRSRSSGCGSTSIPDVEWCGSRIAQLSSPASIAPETAVLVPAVVLRRERRRCHADADGEGIVPNPDRACSGCEPARGRWQAVPARGRWPAEREDVPTMVAKRISRPCRSLSHRCLKLIPPASSASHAVAPVISLAAECLDLKPPLRTPRPGDLVCKLGEHLRPFSSSLWFISIP